MIQELCVVSQIVSDIWARFTILQSSESALKVDQSEKA